MAIPRIPSRANVAKLAVRSLILFGLFVAKPAKAAQRNYSIVTNQSSITASGNVDGFAPIQEQGTDSLITSYTGTIKTDRVASSIQFLSGSTIDANDNGSWKPLADGSDGSASADYGGKATILFVTVNFAGRNLVAGLTSGELAIDGSGHFDLSTTDVAFASGDLSYRGPGGNPVGAASIAGEDALMSGTGSLSSLVQGGADHGNAHASRQLDVRTPARQLDDDQSHVDGPVGSHLDVRDTAAGRLQQQWGG